MASPDPRALAVAAAIEFRPQVDWGAPLEIENQDCTYVILDAPDRPDWLVAEVARGPERRVVVDLFEQPSAIPRPDGSDCIIQRFPVEPETDVVKFWSPAWGGVVPMPSSNWAVTRWTLVGPTTWPTTWPTMSTSCPLPAIVRSRSSVEWGVSGFLRVLEQPLGPSTSLSANRRHFGAQESPRARGPRSAWMALQRRRQRGRC